MASEAQLVKLEKIKTIVDKTPNKEVPKALSKDHIGYEKAIRSITNLGQWAIASAIISIATAIIFLAFKFAASHIGPSNSELILSLLVIGLSATTGVLGYKLWNLQSTPEFTLFSVILILGCNILLVVGFIPFITAIKAIITISRFDTFRSWFASM